MELIKGISKKLLAVGMCVAIIGGVMPVSNIVPDLSVSVEAAGVEDLTFSRASGYYADEFDLEITGPEGQKIYYTTDSSVPDPASKTTKEYTGAIRIKNLKGTPVVLSNKKVALTFCEDIRDEASKDNFYAFDNDPQKVDRASVIRAITVDGSGNKSKVSTRTYFVGNNYNETYGGCAVMSLVTDPDNLLNPKNGIYVLGEGYDRSHNFNDANFAQRGKEWERPANMEFFDGKDTVEVTQGVGIRIHGGYSRRNQQKSMNIYFRDTYDYGTKNLKGYELIPGTSKYSNIMIRNGGNDADFTKFKDKYIQDEVSFLACDTQKSRPCMVYLNGEYWGLYNLTEKYSDNYYQYKYGVDNNNVVSYKDYDIDEGEDLDPDGRLLEEYRDLANLDMTKAANYKKFTDAVDVDSFIDYNAVEVYIDNGDWWEGCTNIHNHLMWRVVDPSKEEAGNEYADGRWRYSLFDTEFSMGWEGGYSTTGPTIDSLKKHLLGGNSLTQSNTNTGWGGGWGGNSNNGKGDTIFTAAAKNSEFANRYITRVMDLRNGVFEYYRSCNVIAEYVAKYSTLVEKHVERWGWSDIPGTVNTMKYFLYNRQDYVMTMLEANFPSITKSDRVNLVLSTNVVAPKEVKVNDMTLDLSNQWKAIYYKNNKLRVEATDVEGYKFDHWEVVNASVEDSKLASTTITLDKSGSVNIKGVYVDSEGNAPVPTVSPVPTATPIPPATPVPTNTPKPSPTKRPDWNWPNWDRPGMSSPTPKPSNEPQPTTAANSQPTSSPAAATDGPVVSPTIVPSVQPPVATDVPSAGSDTKVYTVKKGVYRILTTNTAELVKSNSKTAKTYTVPATVKIEGKNYKVTAIAKNAFKKHKKLKLIKIKSKNLKLVGKSAFKGVHKNAVVKVPKDVYNKYKKLLKGKGIKTSNIRK
ncbi:MAG: hypothetical protein E7265_04060 [Lachnospiraceae bacterium]|nr:hypothetical protein [Lachnospiraceae bacterium]